LEYIIPFLPGFLKVMGLEGCPNPFLGPAVMKSVVDEPGSIVVPQMVVGIGSPETCLELRICCVDQSAHFSISFRNLNQALITGIKKPAKKGLRRLKVR